MTGTSVLEMHRINGTLRVGLYAREATVRSYTDIPFQAEETSRLSAEVLDLLHTAGRLDGTSAGLFDSLKANGRLLFDLLFPAAVKAHIQSCRSSHLILHIDDSLTPIPWELLFDGKEFLCLRFATGRRLSTARPGVSPSQGAGHFPARMLILSNPTGDLPGAAREAELLCRALDRKTDKVTVSMKAEQVSKDYFNKHVRDFDILHYAGHADYTPGDPARSGWVLADGRITTSAIASMGSLPMPALVFMNSCQSAHAPQGSPDKEAALCNLADAFLQAGVRHVVGTLWQIPDDQAPALARDFYRGFAEGASIGMSLQGARRNAMRDSGPDHLGWASYVLYGDPSVSWEGSAAGPDGQHTPAHPTPVRRAAKILPGLIGTGLFFVAAAAVLKLFPTLNPWAYSKLVQSQKFFSAGQYELSAQWSMEAVGLDPKYAQARLQLGRAYEKLGKYREAQVAYSTVKDSYLKHSSDPADLIFLYVDMARNAYAGEDYAGAQEYLTNILTSPHARVNAKDLLLLHRALANACFMNGMYADSRRLAAEGLRLALAGTSKTDIALAYLDVARTMPAIPPGEARETYQKALAAARAAGHPLLEVRALSGLGDVDVLNAEHRSAAHRYKEAAALLLHSPDKRPQNTIVLNSLYLKLAQEDIELLNFADAGHTLRQIQRLPALPPGDATTELTRSERTLLQRRFEFLLQHLARKGYKNSDLYKRAAAVYDKMG